MDVVRFLGWGSLFLSTNINLWDEPRNVEMREAIVRRQQEGKMVEPF